jgi:hypothetical protein
MGSNIMLWISFLMSDHPSSWIVLTNCNDFSLISSTQKEEESYNLSNTNSESHENMMFQ